MDNFNQNNNGFNNGGNNFNPLNQNSINPNLNQPLNVNPVNNSINNGTPEPPTSVQGSSVGTPTEPVASSNSYNPQVNPVENNNLKQNETVYGNNVEPKKDEKEKDNKDIIIAILMIIIIILLILLLLKYCGDVRNGGKGLPNVNGTSNPNVSSKSTTTLIGNDSTSTTSAIIITSEVESSTTKNTSLISTSSTKKSGNVKPVTTGKTSSTSTTTTTTKSTKASTKPSTSSTAKKDVYTYTCINMTSDTFAIKLYKNNSLLTSNVIILVNGAIVSSGTSSGNEGITIKKSSLNMSLNPTVSFKYREGIDDTLYKATVKPGYGC